MLGAVPIDNGAIDATADHVFDLAADLTRISGFVANIDVLLAGQKERHNAGVDLCGCVRIEQRPKRKLTHMPRSSVSVFAAVKFITRAGVVPRLRIESSYRGRGTLG